MLACAGLATQTPFPGATYVGNCELRPVERQPAHVPHQEGLDGRLYTDLSSLDAASPLTPTSQFFIRTRASPWLPQASTWQVRIGSESVPATWFDEHRSELGNVLLECSGNNQGGAFRMLSAATWEGVPVRTVLEKAALPRTSGLLQVSGFDEYPDPSTMDPPSTPGADWIFPVDRLLASDAAMATRMNGEPLPRDHGAPVRLLVPNWYGCTNIKWVNDIRYVSDDAPSTSHMRWFASRTHQTGVPEWARDYRDARIGHAAMPIRVEHWRYEGRPFYRIVGIVWGGEEPASGLIIRCGGERAPIHKVGWYVPPADTRTWSFWYHQLVPNKPGLYPIRVQTNPPTPGGRLARGYYTRAVVIPEV